MEALALILLTSIGSYFFLRLENLSLKIDCLGDQLEKLQGVLDRIMDA